VTVLRNDDPRLDAAAVAQYDGICIGPGPGRPRNAGKTMDVIDWALEAKRPVLGVCLGLQALGEHFGGDVVHAPSLMHGKTSQISHDASGVFMGITSPFEATRYHSLCLDPKSLPAEFQVTATSEDGVVQGVAHRAHPLHGVQFHPESVLTPEGHRIFSNFLAMVRA
jgi:para-aminobenzoate synthetase component 2